MQASWSRAQRAQDLSRAGYYQHEDVSALDIQYDTFGMHNMSDAEYTTPITHDHFKETLDRTSIVVINFYAPWCHWCDQRKVSNAPQLRHSECCHRWPDLQQM